MRLKFPLKLLIFLVLSTLVGCGTERNAAMLSTMCQHEPVKSDKEPVSIAFSNDFSAGLQAASEQERPMLVFFTLPQCANAQQMMETTFRDKEIRKLSQRFVCVLVDSSKNASLCEERRVKGFPAILLLSSQGGEIQRMSGHQNADQLSVQMQVALQSTASQLNGVVRGTVPLNR